ncbi:MAG: hypothetical protein GY906_18065 [bacterium]|nr:hypothetical protein [bacterium]
MVSDDRLDKRLERMESKMDHILELTIDVVATVRQHGLALKIGAAIVLAVVIATIGHILGGG